MREASTLSLIHFEPEIECFSVRGCWPDAEDRVGHEGVRDWFDTLTELFDDLRADAPGAPACASADIAAELHD
jgi:hypothetical protein